jgi:hypothetical protein
MDPPPADTPWRCTRISKTEFILTGDFRLKQIRIPMAPRSKNDRLGRRGVPGDSIRAAHLWSSKLPSEPLINPSTIRVACSEEVWTRNPLPTAENPLRFWPAISCSTRKTIMSAFISALEPPSDRGRKISIWTAALGGGQVGVKTKDPATLMSRVTPSPWKCPLSGPIQRNLTEAFIRYRMPPLRSTEPSDLCAIGVPPRFPSQMPLLQFREE